MSITAHNKTIVNFEPHVISGLPMVGGYMLRFVVRYSMPEWRPEEGVVLFRNAFANIRLNDRLLGRAELEASKTFVPYTYAYDANICFDISLTSTAIEEIEKIRSGGDLELKMEVMGEIIDSKNVTGGREDITFRLNNADWIKALKQMGYGSYLLYELPIDIKPEEEFQAAIHNLERAKKHFYLGHYAEVVSVCRQALELIMPEEKALKKIKEETKTKPKEAQTKDERLALFLDSLKHLTSLAHHCDHERNNTSFTRDEAIMVLGTTAAAISSVNTARKKDALKNAA